MEQRRPADELFRSDILRVMPPSTTKSAPVMKPARSLSSRKATISAISSGLPTRPTGRIHCQGFVSARSADRRRAPFRPGAVVERLRCLADGVEREPQRRRGHARSATGDDRLRRDRRRRRRKRSAICSGATSRPFSISSVDRHVERARHVARAHARAAAPAPRRGSDWPAAHRPPARICRQRTLHVGHAGDRGSIELGGEPARRALDRAGFDRSALGLPFRQPAVEDEHVACAEDAKRPPHPRRAAEPGAVVDHDGVVVGRCRACRHRAANCAGARQHVGQLGLE